MNTQTETVEHWWLTFATAVMPPDAPAVQRREMKKAFFAGVWSMLNAQLHVVFSEACSANTGAEMLRGWYDECEEFKQAVLRGKA